eukprot:scaffold803_cov310-Pinguiococcus_pyrenoidosus.AAC.113
MHTHLPFTPTIRHPAMWIPLSTPAACISIPCGTWRRANFKIASYSTRRGAGFCLNERSSRPWKLEDPPGSQGTDGLIRSGSRN